MTFYFRAEYGAAQLIVPAPASPASGDERPWSGAVDRGAGGDWSVPAAERDFHELVGRYAAERGNDERG